MPANPADPPKPTTQPTSPPAAPAPDLSVLQSAIEREVSVDQSAIKLIQGLANHLTQLSTKPSVAPADLAALAKKLNDSAGALAAAVSANTPAADH